MPLPEPNWPNELFDKRWLLAVSGGRDSVALFHLCIQAGMKNLVVCHVNHQLRGEESNTDEAFVLSLAEKLKLPYFIRKVDVSSIAETEQKSLELAAREARHSVFSEACNTHACDGVLLAHHADDQAETVLYNLLRGSAGLKGMQAQTTIQTHGLSLHRPLLSVRRSEINSFITEHQLDFREDSSNAEPFAVRNRMRNEVLPLLTEVVGRDVVNSILKSHQTSQEQDLYLENVTDYAAMLDPQGRIHLPSLIEQPEIIRKRVIHRYLREQGVSDLSEALITSCLSLIDPSNSAKINLPKDRYFRRKEQRLFTEG